MSNLKKELSISPSLFKAKKPSDVIADGKDEIELSGVCVRKGTVAATIYNAKVFDQIENDSISQEMEVIQEINSLIPGLKAAGLFDFFSPLEWLNQSEEKKGRALVAILYLQQFPEEMNEGIRNYLCELKLETGAFKSEVQKLLDM